DDDGVVSFVMRLLAEGTTENDLIDRLHRWAAHEGRVEDSRTLTSLCELVFSLLKDETTRPSGLMLERALTAALVPKAAGPAAGQITVKHQLADGTTEHDLIDWIRRRVEQAEGFAESDIMRSLWKLALGTEWSEMAPLSRAPPPNSATFSSGR